MSETRKSRSERRLLETEPVKDYMSVGAEGDRAHAKRVELYDAAIRECGAALDRVPAGYEANPQRRGDLRQEIHLQLWRSLEVFDGRCSLKTWAFRVAHNTAVSYVNRERRTTARFVTLDEAEGAVQSDELLKAIDESRALERLLTLIRQLRPPDRQVMLSYLEGLDAAGIAEITGLSAAHVAVKVSRAKQLLARSFFREEHHV